MEKEQGGVTELGLSGKRQLDYQIVIMQHISRITGITTLPPTQFATPENLSFALIMSIRTLAGLIHPYQDDAYHAAVKDLKYEGLRPAEQQKVVLEQFIAIMDLLHRKGLLLETALSEEI